HPAALLVDHDGGIAAADAAAHVGDQGADLLRRLAVALEQDEAERLCRTEEAPLIIGERRSQTAEDTGQRCSHQRRTLTASRPCSPAPASSAPRRHRWRP